MKAVIGLRVVALFEEQVKSFPLFIFVCCFYLGHTHPTPKRSRQLPAKDILSEFFH